VRRSASMVGMVAVLLAMYSGSAVAQEATATEEQQLTLPAGKLFLDTFIEVSLAKDAAFKPVSVAPDLWYGASDDLTLGLVHSGRGATGLFGRAGDGLCLTGKSNGGCPKVYNNIGLDARYHLWRKNGITLAADGGLFARSLDPFALSLKLGAIGRFQTGALSFELGPNLFFGMTKRGSGNKEVLAIPATVLYALPSRLGIAAQLGLLLPLEDTASAMFGASIGVQYFATDKLILDAVFSLPALAGGKSVPGGLDVRTFTLGVAYAF
jgi:opacity protein-like surface antigen